MRLQRYDGDPATVAAVRAAPGWPHADTADALGFAAAGGRVWLIVDDDGLVAGECGTHAPPSDDGTVEIGYGLAARRRGRGLGTRAVAALVDELDKAGDVRRIVARVHPDNLASRRLLERLGFALDQVDLLEVGYGLDLPVLRSARDRE